MFVSRLDGASGSEPFELIAQPACVNVGGNGNVNLNGEWFLPAQAGYGFDAPVPVRPAIRRVLHGRRYRQSALGCWRQWAVRGDEFDRDAAVDRLRPVCTYVAFTTQPAGNMTVTYANGSSGQLSTAITLNAPLNGAWNVNQPIARLTGATDCSP